MKKNVVKTMLSLTLAASMVLGAPASLYAAEEPAAEDTEEAAAEETGEDLKVVLTEGELVIKNQTTRVFEKAELVKREAKAEEAKTEETKETKEEPEEVTDLVVTEENGDTHTYETVSLDKATDAVIYDQYGFLYIKYKDENGKEQEAIETAEEKKLDAPLTMYASSNVHIRKEADAESDSVKVIQMGTECKVVAMVPGWMQVEAGEDKGFVFHSFITEDKASVDAALKAKAEAEAAAAAAAAQAQAEAEAAAAAQAQAQQQQQQQAPAVYEVSRVAYDDCDGSGHGYFEITYSDGSVAYEEY